MEQEKILQQATPMEPEWLTIREAAASIPGRPHESTVARWTLREVRGKKLPSTLIGGKRLIKRADLLEFLNLREKQTPAEGQTVRQTIAAAQVDALLG